MRKLFSLFLALVATTSLWAEDFSVGGIYYNYLDGNNVEVTYRGNDYNSYYNEYSGAVIIPSTVRYNGTTYSVTSIGDYAFFGCSSLTSITIPNSITNIGDGAFHYCSFLTSMKVENGNTTYDSRDNCNAIIETATNTLIASCKNTIIPNSVTSIGDYAFYGCSSLTSIAIPNSVTIIGKQAFSYCSSLTSITIPEGVTSIGIHAFYNCSSLTTPVYNAHCFAYMPTSFKGAYVIPEGIKQIAGGAFAGCSSLTSVTIPNSVTSIGDGAFYNCSSLTSITIPNSVTSIEYGAFYNCSSLTSITIPNSVTNIGERAFWNCTSLTSITIPNSVTNIGDVAFYNCSSLTSITIPNSVTSIGNSAFLDCTSLTSIACEATTPPILGTNVFNRTKLSAVYIPDNTLSAYQTAWGNEYVFVNNENTLTLHVATPGTLEDLIFDAGTRPVLVAKLTLTGTLNDADFTCMRETMTSLVDVDLSGITNTLGVNFDGKENLVRIILPTNLTSIGNYAFNNCRSLTSITIPNSVTSIGKGAFYDCSSLISVTIPNSVTRIGIAAFYDCFSLTSVTIPNSVTSIGYDAFWDCSSLTSITIPNSVTSIGDYAFYYCESLDTVICLAMTPPALGEDVFYGCDNPTLFVPCAALSDYQVHEQWGQFTTIECIASEETEAEEVVIESGTTIVIITWPTEEGADTYTIVIKKDGEVVCTLTFNSEGQLISIAFAPGRDGNHPAQYAEAVANGKGFRFTVTGLEDGTDYTYDITVKNEANQVIKTHSGKFTTEPYSAVDNTHSSSSATNTQKLLRNGQLIILRDGVEYNAMGQEL